MNNKLLLKTILSKIPLFLFCVLFISSYNNLFGQGNSIVGVIILTGLLIFMRNDFGTHLSQALKSFIILFLILAIAPKLSLINAYAGLLINFISIFSILVISSHDLKLDNHVPFLLGYIFCQGYDVDGYLYVNRFISFIIGALLIALIYYVTHKDKQYDYELMEGFHEFNIHTERTQWYLKLSITLSLVMFVGDLTNFPRTMWISLSVLSLMQPLVLDYHKRGIQRMLAVLVATCLFYFLMEKVIPANYIVYASVAVGFFAMYANTYFTKSIFNSFNALIPAMMLSSSISAIILRISANAIGILVAIISNLIFQFVYDRLDKI